MPTFVNSNSLPPQVLSQSSSYYNNDRNGNDRCAPSLVSHYQEVQMNRQASNPLSMFHYDEHTEDPHQHYHHQSRIAQQDRSNSRHPQSKYPTLVLMTFCFLSNKDIFLFRKLPTRTTINSNNNRVLSVSGRLRCSKCADELGRKFSFVCLLVLYTFTFYCFTWIAGHGSAMVIESLGLYYHIECFRCFVCNIPLSSSFEGTDVRVRNNRLHCQNCFSDENGKEYYSFYHILITVSDLLRRMEIKCKKKSPLFLCRLMSLHKFFNALSHNFTYIISSPLILLPIMC